LPTISTVAKGRTAVEPHPLLFRTRQH